MFFNKRSDKEIKSKIEEYEIADDVIAEVRRVLSKGEGASFRARIAIENLFGHTFCFRSTDNYFAANAYCFFDTVFIVYFASWMHAHKFIDKAPEEMKAFIQAYQTSMMKMVLDASIFNISEDVAKKLYDDRMRTYSGFIKDGKGLDDIITIYSRLVQYEKKIKDICIPMLLVPLKFSLFNEEEQKINTYIENAIAEIVELVFNSNENSIDYYGY